MQLTARVSRSTTSAPAIPRSRYLRRLPVDEIKIDRSFIKDLETDADDAAIVHSTIDLAHSLGLRSSPRASRPS